MDIYEKILTALKNIPTIPDDVSTKQGNHDTYPTDREHTDDVNATVNGSSQGNKRRQIIGIIIAALTLLVAVLAWLLPRH